MAYLTTAVTSDFAFMLSSVFSQYNDVYVMPTKCLKAENLFDIVKRLIICLQEIDFQVLSIMTDNNAINKKLHLSLTVPQSFPLYIHTQL